jgi:uncharacterized repeat protein (TIGR01451 family)
MTISYNRDYVMKPSKPLHSGSSSLWLGLLRRKFLFAFSALLFVTAAVEAQVVAPAAYSPLSLTQQPFSVTVGDAHGLGTTEMVITGTSTVTVLSCTTTTCTRFTPNTVGTNPVGVVIGDFNGDGKPDMAVANSSSNNVTVLLNNGDTTFSQATGSPIAVGTGPTGIAAGDFNGDGRLDLAVSNTLTNNVTILLGNGDGTFHSGPGSPVAVGNVPSSLVVADLNGDGKLDLAVGNQTDSTVSILLGNGSGGFSAASGSPFAVGLTPRSIAIGDVNGDGALDLAFTGGAGTATVLLGRGDGTFAADPFGAFPVASAPTHIAIGDVDGDGNLDLVVSSNAGNGNISLLLGSGNGGFVPAFGSPFTTSAVHSYSWVAVGDVNGDGRLDIEAVSDDNNLTVLLNVGSLTANPAAITFNVGFGQGASPPIAVQVTKQTGSNTFYSATGTQNWMAATPGSGVTPDTLMVSVNPLAMTAGTFRGKVILRSSQNGDGLVGVTMNIINPSGTLAPLFGSPFTSGAGPRSIAAGDFNGDGKPDVAVANMTDGIVTILLSNGGGGFTPGSAISVASPSAIAAGDVNGDGKTDLIVGNSSGAVTVLLGNGFGAFSPSPGGPYPVGTSPNQIAIGDFNGDGKPDLVVANTQLDMRVLLGIGGGGFERAPAIGCTCQAPFAIGDFNGDGITDLAAVNAAGAVQIIFGTSSSAGVFSPRGTISGITNPASVVAADFNGDGKLDVATLNSDGTVAVVLGDGQGGFGAPITTSAVNTPGAMVVADFNGDGILDLAATNAAAAGGVAVLLGTGAGAFTQKSFPTGSEPVSVVAADFNGDGIPDLATANLLDNNVTVMLGGLAPTSATLTAPTAAMSSQTVNMSVQVALTGTAFINSPTGTVSFRDGSTVLQTVNLVGGAASFSTTFAPGTHVLTARFNGDSRARAVTSNTVNLVVTGPPLLSITKTHAGSFMRGQLRATYTVTVSNSASSLPTSGTVTVTDTLPTGLTFVSMTGTGWACPGTATTNCTRSDVLNAGSSYPPITVTVNVAANAPSSVTNQASVSGGGSVTNSTSDVTAVTAPAHGPGDLDGNGTPDLIWMNDMTRQVFAWYMGGPLGNNFIGSAYLAFTGMAGWTVVGLADFNGDGSPDLVWQNDMTRQVFVWYLSGPIGNNFIGSTYLAVTGMSGWSVVSVADVNGDGSPDLVWQNDTTGQVFVWYMGGLLGNQFLGSTFLAPTGMGTGWTVVGMADFNSDGKPDIVWQNASTGQVFVWYMGGALGNQFLGSTFLAPTGMGAGWSIVGTADFNGDGKPDLVWQNATTRQVFIWYMGGTLGNQFLGATYLAPTGMAGWTVRNRY